MDSDGKFWVNIWLIIGTALTIVLTSAIVGGYLYSGLLQKLQTIQREDLVKHCKQVDVHRNEYGGVTSYECADRRGEEKQ